MKSKRRHKQTAVPHSLTERHSLAFTAKVEASRIPQQTDFSNTPQLTHLPIAENGWREGIHINAVRGKGTASKTIDADEICFGSDKSV